MFDQVDKNNVSIRNLKDSDVESIIEYFYGLSQNDVDRIALAFENLPPREEMYQSILDLTKKLQGSLKVAILFGNITAKKSGFVPSKISALEFPAGCTYICSTLSFKEKV